MPESYTPREFIEKINAENPGSVFDPYGVEGLIIKKQEDSAGADLLAQAKAEVAKEKEKSENSEKLIEEAQKDLGSFVDYLRWNGLNDEKIRKRLGELIVYYDEESGAAIIGHADKIPFDLNLSLLNLEGKLMLPKQLNINRLTCGNNQLTELPDELPTTLKELLCGVNKLGSLPENLPDGLEVILCQYNLIMELPATLPSSLRLLDCHENPINELSELPASLKKIAINGRNLSVQSRQTLNEQQMKIGFELIQ
jgi:hypothetical protein